MVRKERKLLNAKDYDHMKTIESTDTTQAATVAEQDAHVAPDNTPSKKSANTRKGAPKGRKTPRVPKPRPPRRRKKGPRPARKPRSKPNRKAAAPRAASKGAKILR